MILFQTRISTIFSPVVTDKGNIKTGSDNKMKAENDNDNTGDGKKQKGVDEEQDDGVP